LNWKHCSADLFVDHQGRVFLYIVFEKEITDTPANGTLIGIDRGVKKLATTSTGKFFGGGRVKFVSDKYREQRKQLQSKGTRSAQRHLTFIRGKERRFRTDVNHCISKQIVETLQSGDTIVLEKLTGIRKRARRLTKAQKAAGMKTIRKDQRRENNNWSFYQLEQFLTYKAAEKGIGLVFVDPRYTSQRCSKCVSNVVNVVSLIMLTSMLQKTFVSNIWTLQAIRIRLMSISPTTVVRLLMLLT